MRNGHHVALLASVLAVALLAALPQARSQEAPAEPPAQTAEAGTAPQADVVPEPDAGLSPDEMDTLVGPVALFSDTLLTQVLMAATYPLDVVKADRWLKDNAALSDQDRAAAAADQDWDASIQQLAAGFPSVITRMAEHIDWTEQAGEAVLSQTDDVLDSVQRLRAQAKLNGYLTDNDAQVVETADDGNITISSANADVVYVPTYDPQVVYTTPAPATPYYVSDDDDWDDALATGAIFFGSAILINEIFDNDDWDDYWHGGRPIDWNDGDFHPRPGIDIGGDVNIDRGDINIDRDRFTNIDRENINFDRDTIQIDRDRPDGTRPGSLDRDALDKARDRGFAPDAASRDAAMAKIEARKGRGEGVAHMPPPGQARDKVQARPAGSKPQLKPPSTRPQVHRPANVSKPAMAKRPSAPKASGNRGSAMKQHGGARAHAASNRGHASRGGGGGRRR